MKRYFLAIVLVWSACGTSNNISMSQADAGFSIHDECSAAIDTYCKRCQPQNVKECVTEINFYNPCSKALYFDEDYYDKCMEDIEHIKCIAHPNPNISLIPADCLAAFGLP